MPETDTIVEKLKEIKRNEGYTLQHIADISGVPIGTVNRVFSQTHYDFKYDTIKPLVRALGLETDVHEIQHEESTPYIELLRSVIQEKNVEIDRLKIEKTEEINRVKAEVHDELSEFKADYRDNIIKPLRRDKVIWRTVAIVCISVIILMFVFDFIITDKGWLQRQLSTMSEGTQQVLGFFKNLFSEPDVHYL